MEAKKGEKRNKQKGAKKVLALGEKVEKDLKKKPIELQNYPSFKKAVLSVSLPQTRSGIGSAGFLKIALIGIAKKQFCYKFCPQNRTGIDSAGF